MSELEVRVARDPMDPYDEDVRFYLRERNAETQTIGIVRPLVLDSVPISEVNGRIVDPTFRLDSRQAQRMMDGLWECGLRPSEGSGSAGSLAATERHLTDMQRIVFKDYS